MPFRSNLRGLRKLSSGQDSGQNLPANVPLRLGPSRGRGGDYPVKTGLDPGR